MRGRLLRQAIAISLIAWALVASLERLLAYVVNGPRWPTSSVTYFVNPANADVAPANALAAVQQAASAWSLQSLADIQLIYAGSTSGTTVQNNGVNEVFFSPESSGSTIAVCYYWWNGSNQIVDSDIKFYDGGFTFHAGTSGCSGGMFIEDVGTHEFGHFLGLGHSTVAAATMYPSISYCSQSARVLDADDIAGVEAIYTPGSGSPPAAPYDLGVAPSAAQPTSSLVLTWTDAASTETGFRVERSTNGTTFSQIASPGANVVSFTDSGLAAATTYFYRVRAYNGAGASTYSNIASRATAAVTTPPAAPSGPTPASGAVNVTATTVSWAAASGATSYDLYFGTNSNPPLRSTTSATSVSVGKLSAGVTHYWRVVAKNSFGSTTGPTWSFTTKPKGRR
jgi:hypothetical protein